MLKQSTAEKGFATILGLCLILVIALVVKGIQAAETNHAYETADFQAEFELQNAADSAIYAAVDKVLVAKENGEEILPVNNTPGIANSRQNNQRKLITTTTTSEHFGKITVRAYGEQINIHPYQVSYKGDNDNVANKLNPDDLLPSYVFYSVAQATSKHTGKKIYRRAFAYVLRDGDATIHFMEVPMSSYRFGS